jgi:uncharacterized protein
VSVMCHRHPGAQAEHDERRYAAWSHGMRLPIESPGLCRSRPPTMTLSAMHGHAATAPRGADEACECGSGQALRWPGDRHRCDRRACPHYLRHHHRRRRQCRPGEGSALCASTYAAARWRIIPVNPHADAILGEHAYRTLRDVPGQVGLVNVFRPPEQTPDIGRQAVAAGATALWRQLGIASQEARAIAEEAGLLYVEDRCLIIEQRRLRLQAPGSR